MENNEILKQYLKENGITHWRLAKRLGISDITFYKHIRDIMPQERFEKYMDVAKQMINETGARA